MPKTTFTIVAVAIFVIEINCSFENKLLQNEVKNVVAFQTFITIVWTLFLIWVCGYQSSSAQE